MHKTAEEQSNLVFKALAAPSRRRILAVLAMGPAQAGCCAGEGEREEFCACDLTARTGLGAPTISHHMKALIEAGLVSAEKRGLWVFYRLRPETLAEAIGELRSLVSDEVAWRKTE